MNRKTKLGLKKRSCITRIGLIFKCIFIAILSFMANTPIPEQVKVLRRAESHSHLP